jgi:branched-chain amino acid transport system permease protein
MLDATFIAQTIVSGVGIGCVFGLIGIGYCVIYNASGIVNFAQGAFVMLGGMITHALLKSAGLPLFLAAVIAVAVVALSGVLVERLVVRPLWRRNATPFVMILATLAVQIVLERATLLVAGDQPQTLPNFIDLPPLMLGKVAISYQLMVIAASSLLLVGLLALFFGRTRVGRAMRACSINREAAALQGIPVSRMLAYAFALSAGLGAVAGVLITPTQFTAFNIGVSFAISGFIAAIVGGFGNPGGAFVGGILLGLAQAVATVVLGSGFKNIAALSILLVFITIRPMGIFGKPGIAK